LLLATYCAAICLLCCWLLDDLFLLLAACFMNASYIFCTLSDLK
jgi:hypothetical protein